MMKLTEVDLAINLFIQENLRTDWLTVFMKGFTVLNNAGLLAIAMVLLFLLFKRYQTLGLAMGFSLSLQFCMNNLILKPLVARPRPYVMSEEVILLVREAIDYSFPSGHTGSMFAISTVMVLLLPKQRKWLGWFAIGLSFLMAFSRLYVGIHYPSDVLGGIVLGLFSGKISLQLFYKLEARKLGKKN